MRTNSLIKLSRTEVKSLVGIVTGHCCLNNHLKRIKLSVTPTCQCCYEDDETAAHFLCECSAYSNTRQRIMGAAYLDYEELLDLDLQIILKFLKGTGRIRAETD